MRLFIRTEASTALGMGHFMRCFAIAEAARAENIEVTFLLNEIRDAVAARIESIGAHGREITGPLGYEGDFMLLAELGLSRRDWLLVDSYQATDNLIRTLSNAARVAVMDDLCLLESYDCDLIVNAAEAAFAMPYKAKTPAKLLLGAAYAQIRQEFLQAHLPVVGGPSVTVMFGGSDPQNFTGLCAEILHDTLPDVAIKVIAGPANVHGDALSELAQRLKRLHLFIAPDSVAQVLAGSDLVVTAAGGSVGEVAAMGLPALALVVVDNQVAALKACPYPVIDARHGLPEDLGARVRALMDEPELRQTLATAAHELIDGQGARRIVEVMTRV